MERPKAIGVGAGQRRGGRDHVKRLK